MHVKVPQFAYEYVEKARLWFTIRRLSIVPGIVGKEILCVKKKKRTKPRHENGGVRRKGSKKGDRKSGGRREVEEVAEQVSFHCGIPAATSIET